MARHFANEPGFALDAENQRVGSSNWFKAVMVSGTRPTSEKAALSMPKFAMCVEGVVIKV
ncbi:hypothetical protein [Rhizobium sp. CCGE 510]|uniref:hypothetical protein n=1 Tax=Rhizobium sp. CCGE 510 TaxID=1132836 RepID=UPI0002FADC61|nr:hypothetical protein [Rhizobium sp. CCGE 510]